MKNKITIRKQKLTSDQANFLTEEVIKVPNISYFRPDFWLKIPIYATFVDGEFAGACGLVDLSKDFKKIGPFVILRKFQAQGIGKRLFEEILKDNKDKKLLIYTTNPAMMAIVRKNNFSEVSTFYMLSPAVFVYIIKHILGNISLTLMKCSLRKRRFKAVNGKTFILRPITK